MKQHELRPPRGAKSARKRVGRGPGSGRGKTAGRGMSGQRSRSSVGLRPTFEGGQRPLVQRLPTKRGFHNPFRIAYTVVNVGRLAEVFAAGATVTPELLRDLYAVLAAEWVRWGVFFHFAVLPVTQPALVDALLDLLSGLLRRRGHLVQLLLEIRVIEFCLK